MLRLDVTKNALIGVAEEMGVALQRSAYSTNIKTRKDFSCALFDAQRRVIAHAFAIPSLLGSLPRLVPTVLDEYTRRTGRSLEPGEALITNDAYRGGAHLNDVAMITPVYYRGTLSGYAATIAHQVDIGGATHASLPVSKEIYEEGLNLPPVRIMRNGQVDEEILGIILNNVRASREVAGDLRAQIGAHTIGTRRLEQLIDRFGPDRLAHQIEQLFAYTEERVLHDLAPLPRGTYRAEDFLDDDGHTTDPIRIAGALTIDEHGMSIDFSGSDGQRPSPMNATLTFTYAAAAFFLKCIVGEDIPVNDGFYRTVSVHAPEGTVVNARRPAGVVGGWEVAQRVCGVLFRAFAQCQPDRAVAASKGIMCNIGFGGPNPRRPGSFYAHYETVAGGSGGRNGIDGMDGVQTDLTNTENAPIEELEMQYPVRVVGYELIPDSEGAGAYRGGLGIRRQYQFPHGGMRFSIISDRTRFRPWGIAGGEPGSPARFSLRGTERGIPLRSKCNLELQAGDIVDVCTPGGGGYGNPLDRDPAMVADDVRQGKISVERARTAYGVVVDPADFHWETTTSDRPRHGGRLPEANGARCPRPARRGQ
jgi:N-methylhydantoinase B